MVRRATMGRAVRLMRLRNALTACAAHSSRKPLVAPSDQAAFECGRLRKGWAWGRGDGERGPVASYPSRARQRSPRRSLDPGGLARSSVEPTTCYPVPRGAGRLRGRLRVHTGARRRADIRGALRVLSHGAWSGTCAPARDDARPLASRDRGGAHVWNHGAPRRGANAALAPRRGRVHYRPRRVEQSDRP